MTDPARPDHAATRASIVVDDDATDHAAGDADDDAGAAPHGDIGTDAPAGTVVDRWRRRLQAITVPQLLIAAAIVLYVAYFTRRSLDIHHGLGTASYDSALYDQGVWLLSRFEAPFVTLMGRNLFGDHTSFILLFLVPFYWLWPSAGVLFFSQSLVLGAGAIPVFLYGRKRLESEWMALVPAVAYLLHPAVSWTNLENFHPDAFIGVFVGFAIYFALDHRWRAYTVSVVLALLVKEDASLVIVPLGAWVALRHDRRVGLLTIVGSISFMVVAMFVVMRNLIGVPTRNTWRIPFGGPTGLLRTAVTDPGALVDHLRSDGRPWYLWQMTAPFAFLFARLPTVALISAVVLFTNILSTFWYQYQIEYHYSLVAVPALAMGTVYAIGAIRDLREIRWLQRGDERFVLSMRTMAVGLLAVTSVWTAWLWAPLPFSRDPWFYGNPDTPAAVDARALIERIPGDAVLSAHYRITPHTAHRVEIYQFPTPFRSVLYGPNGNVDGPRLPERAERVEYVMLPTNDADYPVADWELVRPAFDFVAGNDHWTLWQRDRDVALPPPATGPSGG